MVRMKALQTTFFRLCLIGISLSAFACASLPPPDSAPTVSARLLSKAEIKNSWGNLPSTNPFLEPSGMVKGQPDEFVVLQLDFSLPSRMAVNISASVESPDFRQLAWLKDASDFEAYWVLWESMGNAGEREAKLGRKYLPGSRYTYPRGTYSYLVVVMGENPMPRPATIKVQAIIPGIEPKAWTFPLPESPAKK